MDAVKVIDLESLLRAVVSVEDVPGGGSQDSCLILLLLVDYVHIRAQLDELALVDVGLSLLELLAIELQLVHYVDLAYSETI